MEDLYKQKLDQRDSTGRLRHLPDPDDQRSVFLDFSSNDYLGLSKHPALLDAAYEALKANGTGSTGSRLLSGNSRLLEGLETRIAQDKKTEAALVFNSGYQANVAVLSTLCQSEVFGQQPLLFFDRLNHASLYQAARLSNAKWMRYRHRCLDHLEQLLLETQGHAGFKMIVTETLFGMDGDVIDLEAIVTLAQTFNAFLYLDEAHATGLLGPDGYGLSTTLSLESVPHVIMGTFSKALGGFGAYVACSQTVKDYLINFCPGLIYTTALPPPVVAAAFKAWEMLPGYAQVRKRLFREADDLRTFLKGKGVETAPSSTPILPILLKDELTTLVRQQELLKRGIRVSAVRPPTVPPGTSRLRVALTAHHSQGDLLFLKKAFEEQ